MTGSLPARLVRANTFALAVALAPASLAIAADPPVIYDFPEGIACKFALHIESVGGNTVKKEFVDKDGHLVRTISAGRGAKLTFTNPSSGTVLTLRANGSVQNVSLNQDGTFTNVVTGHNVLIFWPTDFPAGPTTTLYAGRVVYLSDSASTFTLLGTSGKSTDICALLA